MIDNLTNDVRVIREKLDDNNVRIGSLTQEVDALRQSMQQMSAATRAATAARDPGDRSRSPAARRRRAARQPPAVGVSPQKLFDAAHGRLHARPVRPADRSASSDYIKSFPKSDLADDAQVDICTAYLQDGKNDKAVEACDLAIRTYPTGDKIPEAYYRKGLALQQSETTSTARAQALGASSCKTLSRHAATAGRRTQDSSDSRRPSRTAKPLTATRRCRMYATFDVRSMGQRQQSHSGRQSRTRCRVALHARRRRRRDAEHGDDRSLERQGAASVRKKPSGTASCCGARSAESLTEYLTKGKQIYVEGRLQTRQWDDKDGNKRYTTEIRGDRVVLLGGGGGGGGDATRRRDAAARGGGSRSASEPLTDDDIPF